MLIQCKKCQGFNFPPLSLFMPSLPLPRFQSFSTTVLHSPLPLTSSLPQPLLSSSPIPPSFQSPLPQFLPLRIFFLSSILAIFNSEDVTFLFFSTSVRKCVFFYCFLLECLHSYSPSPSLPLRSAYICLPLFSLYFQHVWQREVFPPLPLFILSNFPYCPILSHIVPRVVSYCLPLLRLVSRIILA